MQAPSISATLHGRSLPTVGVPATVMGHPRIRAPGTDDEMLFGCLVDGDAPTTRG